MTPTVRLILAFTALFLMLLMTLAWAEANGFVSARVTTLWAKAIVLHGGPEGFRATDGFYPPFPYLLTLMLQGLTGGLTVPIPFVLAAGLGAGLSLMWFFNLRKKGGLSPGAAIAVTLLLVVNPFFLRAVADGPETVLLLIGTWVYARGIVNLRLSGNAPDMMKVAVGLLLLTLSHSYGLLICAGAMPAVILAARPSMLVASPLGYLVSMFFPVVAAVGSLMFISAIFDSALVPPLWDANTPASVVPLLLTPLGLVPVALVAVFRTVQSPPHFMPLLAAVLTFVGAYVLNMVFVVEADPGIALAPLLSVMAVAFRFWPAGPLRTPNMIALPALAVATALTTVQGIASGETAQWYGAVLRQDSQPPSSTAGVAAFLGDKTGIMVDVERNADIVTALGGVDRLVVSGQAVYDLALQGGRLSADYLLTPKQTTVAGDRILRSFPRLKTDTLPRYAQIYEDDYWRVFEKVAP